MALGLSPRSIKALSGVGPRDLARYENGSAPIPRRRLSMICQALSIAPYDLSGGVSTNEATGLLLPRRQDLQNLAADVRRPCVCRSGLKVQKIEN